MPKGKEKQEPKGRVLTPQEIKEATSYLEADNLLDKTMLTLQRVGIVGEEKNALLLFLVMLSRKLQHPLSAICLAKSGTGKSHLMQTVAKCIADEDKIQQTQMTESSLYYYEAGLKNKLLLIEDLTGVNEGGHVHFT